MNTFSPEQYFDISQVSFHSLFAQVKNVWEVLPRLEDYITSLFDTGVVKANYKNDTNIFVGEGTEIQEGAHIVGPAIIGKNCIISHASLLRGNCLLGDNVRIGHAVEVKHAIFLNNATAAHLNYVGNSIVGNNVNISGGAIIANYRLDKKPVTIKSKDQKIETHLEKFGAVLGDGANIGVNAVLNPGTILGKHTVVYPLTSVTGVHKEYDHIT